MADETSDDNDLGVLRARAEALQQELAAAREAAAQRLARAELKVEAVRAGMVDLDGLKLIDPAEILLNEAGEVQGAPALMAKLRRDKPWLFGAASSSSGAHPPPTVPTRTKLATEMTLDEWRVARSELLRRR